MTKKDMKFILITFLMFISMIFILMFFGNIFRIIFNKSIMFYVFFILFCTLLPIITLLYYFYINHKEVRTYEEKAKTEYLKRMNYIYYREKIKDYFWIKEAG